MERTLKSKVIKITLLVAAIMFAGLVLGQSKDSPPTENINVGEIEWLTDLNAAKKAAKESDSRIFAVFYDSSAESYAKFEAKILRSAEFWKLFDGNFTAIRFDLADNEANQSKDTNKQLANLHGIEATPAVIILDADAMFVGGASYDGDEAKFFKEFKAAGGPLPWLTDFAEAAALSQASGRPLYMLFTGSDWCPWCVRLQQELYDHQEFAKFAKQELVLLKFDSTRNPPLSQERRQEIDRYSQQFGVTGLPTVVIISPDGKELYRGGYRRGFTPANYINEYRKAIK